MTRSFGTYYCYCKVLMFADLILRAAAGQNGGYCVFPYKRPLASYLYIFTEWEAGASYFALRLTCLKWICQQVISDCICSKNKYVMQFLYFLKPAFYSLYTRANAHFLKTWKGSSLQGDNFTDILVSLQPLHVHRFAECRSAVAADVP